MSTLRIICVDVDRGGAAHVGGPPEVTRKTFDVPCPKELADWLESSAGSKFWSRTIEGVEVINNA